MPELWYAKTTNTGSPHEQGLIIDENTGKNIAVSYDPKDGPLIAAAPDLREALEELLGIDDWQDEEIAPRSLIRKAKAALAKAKETP